MPIYSCRYKSSRMSGIQVGYFEAENPDRAAQAAQAWCNVEPGRQFISIIPFLTGSAAELLGAMPTEQSAGEQTTEQGEQRRGPGRPPKPMPPPAP